MAAACQLARAKLARYVSSLKESAGAEKTGTLIKAGYLASPKTAERNIVGNASFGGVEYLATRPLAVATDYLHSVLRSAATFGKVKPHEYRQIANTLNVGGLARGAKGISEGVAKAVQLLRTGIDAEKMNEKFDFSETTFKSGPIDKAVHAIFNSLEAQDKPFFGFAYETSLYGRARLMGIREGMTGKRLEARTNELLAAPTEEMKLGATSDAQYATFKNATALSDAASSLRQGIKNKLNNAEPGRKLGLSALSVGLDLTIPFTRVASAITNAGIDYSPVGFAKALIQAADKDPKVQAQLSQQLARASIGTGLTILGYSMFANGTLTGSAPTKVAERNLWDEEGKQANSIKLNGKWHSITFLGPLAIPLLLGANLRRFSGEKEHSTGETAAFAAGSIGKTMTEQSYLQGLSNVIGAMSDPGNKGANAVAGMIPIPPLSGQLATAFDPTLRETHGISERLQAKIPFASKRLPARLTPFGSEIKKTDGGFSGGMNALFDITNSKADRSTPLTKELERLNVGLSKVGTKGTIDKVPFTRTPEELRAITREAGPELRNELQKVVADPDYKKADDDMKREALMDVIRDVMSHFNDKDKAQRYQSMKR